MWTLAAAMFLAAQDPAYETRALETGGMAHKLVAHDLNADGKPDLVVQNNRDLHFFLFDPACGLGPKPSQTLRLDATVFLWTIDPLDGRRFPSLLTYGSRGIQARAFDGGAVAPNPDDLVVHPSIFEGTYEDTRPPIFEDFARDVDLDGEPELLLFLPDRLWILKRHPAGDFRCVQKLEVPIETALLMNWGPHQRMVESSSVPLLGLGDVDGDGRPDLSYYRDESIGVFLQRPDGTFAPLQTMDLVAEKGKRRERFLKFELPPRVDDFNGDGMLDLALIYPSKGRVYVYYGRRGRRDFTRPDALLKVADGWCTAIYLEDLNGDGKRDLVMGVVRKFGIAEGVQAFLSGRVDLELHVYPMQPNGAFTQDPVQELRFSIPFSLQMTRSSATVDLAFRPNFQGDFNRDGLRDMIVASDEKTLHIYPGVAGKVISDRRSGRIVMSPPAGTSNTEPLVADFNGDGVSDLVLRHVAGEGTKAALELKLSK